MKLDELYASVTQNIINELETGAVPWVKPWTSAGPRMPENAVSGRAYSGVNILILWATAQARLYPTHQWLTFKQAIAEGGCVRKGEKGTTVVFVKKLRVGEDDEQKTFGMLKTFCVFNIAQIEGLAPSPPQKPATGRLEAVEAFVAATRADIVHGHTDAMYVPSRDLVLVPDWSAFASVEHYYATVLHECGHWTGAKHRLDRDLANRFGTRAYAAEELVAELTAAFLCAHLSIQGELRHAGYIGDWIRLLKDDPRAIFTASSKASQAAVYLRSFSELVADTA